MSKKQKLHIPCWLEHGLSILLFGDEESIRFQFHIDKTESTFDFLHREKFKIVPCPQHIYDIWHGLRQAGYRTTCLSWNEGDLKQVNPRCAGAVYWISAKLVDDRESLELFFNKDGKAIKTNPYPGAE